VNCWSFGWPGCVLRVGEKENHRVRPSYVLRPPLRVPRRQVLRLQDLPGGRHTNLPVLGQVRQITVELHSEGQKVVSLILQHGPNRSDPIRARRLAGAPFRHHEVKQITGDPVLRAFTQGPWPPRALNSVPDSVSRARTVQLPKSSDHAHAGRLDSVRFRRPRGSENG
jgi:hypothetical protein